MTGRVGKTAARSAVIGALLLAGPAAAAPVRHGAVAQGVAYFRAAHGNDNAIYRAPSKHPPQRLGYAPDAHDLSWSPSGRTLLFWGFTNDRLNDGNVYRLDVTTGRTETVIEHAIQAAWSPDGRQIVFNQALELWVSGSGGQDRRQVPTPSGGAAPDWSPRGNRIAFESDRGLFLVNTDGTSLRRLTKGLDGTPRWSPDGRMILFTRAVVARAGRVRSLEPWLYRVNADGTGLRRLVQGDQGEWSPRGRRIVFVRSLRSAVEPQTMQTDLFTIDAGGRDLRRLTRTATSEWWPAWG